MRPNQTYTHCRRLSLALPLPCGLPELGPHTRRPLVRTSVGRIAIVVEQLARLALKLNLEFLAHEVV